MQQASGVLQRVSRRRRRVGQARKYDHLVSATVMRLLLPAAIADNHDGRTMVASEG